MSVTESLSIIQKQLKAPKSQLNSFGKYKYRSCEDIVEAVKKLLGDNEALLLKDDLVEINDRVYIKATATLIVDGNESLFSTGFAREPLTKKGMDESQITGTASSYARKYALNGLFAIDDTKDADTDEHKKQTAVKEDNPRALQSSSNDELDPGDYVMPVGFKGIKDEKLKDIDKQKLKEQLDYWSKNAKTEKAKEAVACMKLYLG
jgi:hypothetical protein